MNNLSVELFNRRSKSSNPNVYVLSHTSGYPKITFDKFRQRCLSQASLLKQEGVDRNKKVLVTLPDMIETNGLFHGLMRLGAQIYFVHHDTSVPELTEICEKYQIHIVIGESKSIFQITAACVERIFALPDISLDYNHDELQDAHDYLDDDFAVGYISKSKKGEYVLDSFTHGDFVLAMNAMDSILEFNTSSLVLNTALPLSHPFGTMINTIAPFRYGGTHFLFKFYSLTNSINRIINENSINTFIGSPYTVDTMLMHYRTELTHAPKEFYITGERLPPILWRKLVKQFQVSPKNIFSTSSSLIPLFTPGNQSYDDIGTPHKDIDVRLSSTGVLEYRPMRRDDWLTTNDICVLNKQGYYQYLCPSELRRTMFGGKFNCLDIEDHLIQDDRIDDCAVTFDDQNIVISVVLTPGSEIDEADRFNLVPMDAVWDFVESIPRTLNKKKQRSSNG